MIVAILGISFGLICIAVCHKLIGHVQENGTRKVFLTLETIAVTILFGTFLLSEVMKVSNAVTVPGGQQHFEVTGADFVVLFGTILTSMLLYFAALWVQKKLGDDD